MSVTPQLSGVCGLVVPERMSWALGPAQADDRLIQLPPSGRKHLNQRRPQSYGTPAASYRAIRMSTVRGIWLSGLWPVSGCGNGDPLE